MLIPEKNREIAQQQLNWIYDTGMSHSDLIPNWVWLSAVRTFERQWGLPDGFMNSDNFPSLGKRAGFITIEDIEKVHAATTQRN